MNRRAHDHHHNGSQRRIERVQTGAMAVILILTCGACSDGPAVKGVMTVTAPLAIGLPAIDSGTASRSDLSSLSAAVRSLSSGLPEVTRGTDVRAYLDGAGSGLVNGMHKTGIAVAKSRGLSPQYCADTSDSLEQVLPAADAIDVIAAVPDAPLVELFYGERSALATALTTCTQAGAAGEPATAFAELTRAVALVDNRLTEMGYQR